MNIALKSFNTFGLDVYASSLLRISSLDQLRQALNHPSEKKLILGGGSNILFTQDFLGLVIKNEIPGKGILHENEDTVLLKIGAGENWHDLVTYCVEKNWYGIENLALIPGTVGAAPMQNIGAYGVELADVFVSLDAMHRINGEIKIFSLTDCKFGYRSSVFKTKLRDQYVITHVTLKLNKHGKLNLAYAALSKYLSEKNITPTLQDVYQAVIAIRQSKLPDPNEIGNAGSFFKNPMIDKAHFLVLQNEYTNMPFFTESENKIKIPAAWLIEQCGFKGQRFGDAGVHQHQALVLVNYGRAKGNELLALSERIQTAVKQKFNIELIAEVNIV